MKKHNHTLPPLLRLIYILGRRLFTKQVALWKVLLVCVCIFVLVQVVQIFTTDDLAVYNRVISTSTLESIIEISELSTFEAVYNGIASVTLPDKPEQIAYYVSYNATVQAGLDFSKLEITTDSSEKTILVSLPTVTITDIIVDFGSMDYIFLNSKADTSTVSQEAYKACISDVAEESKNQSAIIQLAQQNAENIIEALISPFINQMNADYSLIILSGE